MTTHKTEHRIAEIRFDSSDDEMQIRGIAVPYGRRTEIGSYFTEEVSEGAFRQSLSNDSVVMLAGHEGMPVARVGAGTMKFTDKRKGLEFKATLDLRDTQAKSLAVKVERGDLTGVSVGMIVTREEWSDMDEDMPHRNVREGELLEISLTPFPAYRDTEVVATRDQALREFKTVHKPKIMFSPEHMRGVYYAN